MFNRLRGMLYKGNSDDELLIRYKNSVLQVLTNNQIEVVWVKATVGSSVVLFEFLVKEPIEISEMSVIEQEITALRPSTRLTYNVAEQELCVESPRTVADPVSLERVISLNESVYNSCELPLALGLTIQNKAIVIDLIKQPDILVCGTDAQEMRRWFEMAIASLLCSNQSAAMKFVLLGATANYADIDKDRVASECGGIEALIKELKRRCGVLSQVNVRSIQAYNALSAEQRLGHEPMPYLVVLIDELAALSESDKLILNKPLLDLKWLPYLLGVHFICGTRDLTEKTLSLAFLAGGSSIIAFKVNSADESKKVLDATGAEKLAGNGDMLSLLGGKLVRIQSPTIDQTL
ncbi:MAG: FtsK/SpoIIIE domain-containing protein [Alistipes sp.]